LGSKNVFSSFETSEFNMKIVSTSPFHPYLLSWIFNHLLHKAFLAI
jgi:hypothetical protein